MTWTPQQERALQDVDAWLKQREPQVFKLFGYAGTGKTTLARHLAQNVTGTVRFAAYTGKAASVMRRNGCEGATTLHSLLYLVQQRSMADVSAIREQLASTTLTSDERAELLYELKTAQRDAARPNFVLNPDSVLRETALLVVDEVSMVNAEMKRDILSFGCKVLVLGDPAQLPPVEGAGAFTRGAPDIMLTDIQRQAKDNPIVRWATDVREGRLIPFGECGAARKLRKADVGAQWLSENGGQLLTGKNESRRGLNQQLRRLRGHKGTYPKRGEPLVCLANDHSVGLLNGVTCTAACDAEVGEEILYLDVDYEGQVLKDLEVSTYNFDVYGDPDTPPPSQWQRMREQQFDYGYCLTVHKAQGSQWERVTVCDDGFGKRGGPIERRQWLYTAITRAQHELIIVA